MIDTICIESPMLSDQTIEVLQAKFRTMMEVTFDTGEIHTRFTKASLNGSYDSRVSMQLRDYEYKIDALHYITTLKKVPKKVDCRPYLRVECSLHKLVLGHNCFGGSDDLQSQVLYLLKMISEAFDVELPEVCDWRVIRLDYAKVYDLGSYEAVQQYIRGLSYCNYPRRQVSRYSDTGVYAPGRTTCLKFYHKGVEFYKHDYKRVAKFFGFNRAEEIQRRANNLLRVECEFKDRKLEQIFGSELTIKNIEITKIIPHFDVEVMKLLREGIGQNVIRTSEDVLTRLNVFYGPDLASRLFSSWVILSTMGESVLRKRVSKATYFRHRSQIKSAGISFHNTDLQIVESIIPKGFSPVSSDIRCLDTVEDIFLKIAV